MEKLYNFVQTHQNDDTVKLLLNREKYPETDVELAVSCIESRRKLRYKVKEWYAEPRLIFPSRLSAEQCSSSPTAAYKASLAERIAQGQAFKIADLTGGLGVDSWFFAQKAEAVLYNEMQEDLCAAAAHNFSILGSRNITISNNAVTQDNCTDIIGSFCPDIVYMDPARRSASGKKVFLLEDCTPDVLKLKDMVFASCSHMLIKLSPMADISMVCDRLGTSCREVHIVSSEGECKELLIWMDREWNSGYEIYAVELSHDAIPHTFSFKPHEEVEANPVIISSGLMDGHCNNKDIYLFEPGKSLMKAGAFNLMSSRFGIGKFGKSTHYYLTEGSENIRQYGKLYRIIKILPLDKRNIKSIGQEYPKSEVTARNIPMDTDTLRKRLGVSSGDIAHIFGLKSDTCGNILIVAERK